MSFTDPTGRDLGPSLDRWITGNYGEDQFGPPGACPDCGASTEDAEWDDPTERWTCCCGRVYDDNEAHPDPRDDEPPDFDERRCREG